MEQAVQNHENSMNVEYPVNSPKILQVSLHQKSIIKKEPESPNNFEESRAIILWTDLASNIKQECSDSEKTTCEVNDTENCNAPFTDEKLTSTCLNHGGIKSNPSNKRTFKRKKKQGFRKKKNKDDESIKSTKVKEEEISNCTLDKNSVTEVSTEAVPVQTEQNALDTIRDSTVETQLKKCRESIRRKTRSNTPFYQYSEDEIKDEKPEEGCRKQKRIRVKKYSCEICGKRFACENSLKSHHHSHAGEKRFKCTVCDKEYGWISSYQTHMQTHNGDDAHKCHTCGKVLSSKVTLQRHITRMHVKPEKTFACDRCDRTFMYSHELKYHKEKHVSKREFICEFCGKILADKHYLTAHLRTHTGEKPFVCNICNKPFTWKSLMKQHMKIHVDGYCYQCEICGKQYSAKRSLARHFLLHTDERPYKCKLCDKAFKCGSALASHKDYHLGVKRHKCAFCGKAFLSESNMHKHKKRHIGIKNHSCNLCEKAFITKQELQTHMRSHSRNKSSKRKLKTEYICDSP